MSRPGFAVAIAVFLAAFLVIALPERTLACSCTGLAGQEPDADAAFIGRVTSLGSPGSGPFHDYDVTFAVDRATKGVDGGTVVLRAAGGSGAMCGVEFAIGERWKMYANRGSAGRLYTSLCSGSRQVGGFFAGFIARTGIMVVPALLVGSISIGWILFRRREALMLAT